MMSLSELQAVGLSVQPGFKASNGVCNCKSDRCCFPGKHLRPRLEEDSMDIGIWNLYPNSNYLVMTGKESGIFVIDVDTNGFETFEQLETKYGAFPDTVSVITGSGGRHYYFMLPTHETIPTGHELLGCGIDVCGENGYVVAPPSIHASGNQYKWSKKPTKRDDFLRAPDWLLNLILSNKNPSRISPQGAHSTAEAVPSSNVMIADTKPKDYSILSQPCALQPSTTRGYADETTRISIRTQ